MKSAFPPYRNEVKAKAALGSWRDIGGDPGWRSRKRDHAPTLSPPGLEASEGGGTQMPRQSVLGPTKRLARTRTRFAPGLLVLSYLVNECDAESAKTESAVQNFDQSAPKPRR